MPPLPGQYATPRRDTTAGASYFQTTRAVSGSSAKIVDPVPMYIRPSMTIGVTWRFEACVSNVHAGRSVATLAAVIWVSGEKRCPPGSLSRCGQSVACADNNTGTNVAAASQASRVRVFMRRDPLSVDLRSQARDVVWHRRGRAPVPT